MPVVYFLCNTVTVQIDLSVSYCYVQYFIGLFLECEAETLPAHTFRYADYKNVIKWNLKNALVFTDPFKFCRVHTV